MKYLLSAAVLATMTLAGCSTMSYEDQRPIVIDGETQVVKVVSIPSITVEIDPNKAVCDLVATDGTTVKGECLQYRQPFQKNFNILSGDIQGFEFEPGYRYMLDVRQEAIPNPQTGVVESIWLLNDILAKVPEQY